MARALVIGVGSTLRGDDGVASAVLDALQGQVGPAVTLTARHQLTPELSSDLAETDLTILVDADLNLPPGTVAARQVLSSPREARPDWHAPSLADCLALALGLYSAKPDAWRVGVGVQDFDAPDALSAAARDAVPLAAGAVLAILASPTGPEWPPGVTGEASGA